MAAALVMVPDPRTGAQAVILTFALAPQQILVIGAPNPYLVALHESLSKIAADLGDVDKVERFATLRGVDGDELATHVADALQILHVDVLNNEAGPDSPTLMDNLFAARARLEKALDILTRSVAPPVIVPIGEDDIAAIARRRVAEQREHEERQADGAK